MSRFEKFAKITSKCSKDTLRLFISKQSKFKNPKA